MEKKESSTIHIIVGILAIIGGALFIIDKAGAGGVIIGVGLLIETLKNWLK